MEMSVPYQQPVASLDANARVAFMTKVYEHLLIAVVAFVMFETLLFGTGVAEKIYDAIAGNNVAWLILLGGFMAVNWLATLAAHDISDSARQYAGLFGMAGAEAVIFAPFLFYVFNVEGTGGSATVMSAAVITLIGFMGLTGVGLFTSADLSFMRPMLLWAGMVSIVVVLAAVLFGLELGVWFSIAMIALAGGSILYQTQTILREYPEQAYVGAAVQLFASVMLMFWYVLRLLSRR